MGIPNKCKDRPRVGDLVVPFMVKYIEGEKVDFRQLDKEAMTLCAQQRRCGICGRKMKRGETYCFLGPIRPLQCFDNPWMHESCARYTAAECPFVSDERRRYRDVDTNNDPLFQPYLKLGWAIYFAPSGIAHQELGGWHFRPRGKVLVQRLDG